MLPATSESTRVLHQDAQRIGPFVWQRWGRPKQSRDMPLRIAGSRSGETPATKKKEWWIHLQRGESTTVTKELSWFAAGPSPWSPEPVL